MSKWGTRLEKLSSEHPSPLAAVRQCRYQLLSSTQLTVRFFNTEWEKKGRYVWGKLEGRKKGQCFSLSILIPFQPARSGVWNICKQMNSWQWQLKHPVCQRRKEQWLKQNLFSLHAVIPQAACWGAWKQSYGKPPRTGISLQAWLGKAETWFLWH